MGKTLNEQSVNGKIHIVLEKTADKMTARDFLKITEITKQGGGEIQIIHGSWQVLIGYQGTHRQFVEQDLEKNGYEFIFYFKGRHHLPTFLLNKEIA
jgi:hypothetical protein